MKIRRPFQLFNTQGQPLHGTHSTKEDVLHNGLLHGAAHMWLWRRHNGHIEILLQHRDKSMKTFPDMLDVSSAGHIDGGEGPLETAVREVYEELGLRITADDLYFAFTHSWLVHLPHGLIENEYRWVYLIEMTGDQILHLEEGEVSDAVWCPLAELQADVATDAGRARYVPHGRPYFAMLFEALERITA